MIVSCFKGGCRREDFWISGIGNLRGLDELKEYAENNLPIKCKRIGEIDLLTAINTDEMTEVHLYLNNYDFYSKYDGKYYFLNQEEINEIYLQKCSKCKLHGAWGCLCGYEQVYNQPKTTCGNFKKKFSLRDWIKEKLK